jgi:protein transport protein SEC24
MNPAGRPGSLPQGEQRGVAGDGTQRRVAVTAHEAAPLPRPGTGPSPADYATASASRYGAAYEQQRLSERSTFRQQQQASAESHGTGNMGRISEAQLARNVSDQADQVTQRPGRSSAWSSEASSQGNGTAYTGAGAAMGAAPPPPGRQSVLPTPQQPQRSPAGLSSRSGAYEATAHSESASALGQALPPQRISPERTAPPVRGNMSNTMASDALHASAADIYGSPRRFDTPSDNQGAMTTDPRAAASALASNSIPRAGLAQGLQARPMPQGTDSLSSDGQHSAEGGNPTNSAHTGRAGGYVPAPLGSSAYTGRGVTAATLEAGQQMEHQRPMLISDQGRSNLSHPSGAPGDTRYTPQAAASQWATTGYGVADSIAFGSNHGDSATATAVQHPSGIRTGPDTARGMPSAQPVPGYRAAAPTVPHLHPSMDASMMNGASPVATATSAGHGTAAGNQYTEVSQRNTVPFSSQAPAVMPRAPPGGPSGGITTTVSPPGQNRVPSFSNPLSMGTSLSAGANALGSTTRSTISSGYSPVGYANRPVPGVLMPSPGDGPPTAGQFAPAMASVGPAYARQGNSAVSYQAVPGNVPYPMQPIPGSGGAGPQMAGPPVPGSYANLPTGMSTAPGAPYYGPPGGMVSAPVQAIPAPAAAAATPSTDFASLPRPALDPDSVMYRVWFGDALQRDLLWPQQVLAGDRSAHGGGYNPGAAGAGMPFEPQINFCAFDPTWCCPIELFRPCHPSRMRMSVNFFPNSAATRSKTGLPLAAIVRPLAPPLSDDPLDQVPVVNFGTNGIVRCRRCRTYINFGVTFTDGGRRWRCNICQLLNDVPPEYYSPLDANGKRHDIAERAELCSASVEFVAPSEYMIRPPQPPVYVFVLDVSYGSIISGAFITFVETIRSSLDLLPQDGRTRVAVLTFDTQLTYCVLPPGQQGEPRFLVTPDVDDVFLPTPEDVLASLDESRPALLRLLDKLQTIYDPATLQSTATLTGNALTNGSALGSAVMGAYYIMQHWGGKMVVLGASRPTMGIAKLKDRDDAYALFTDREARLLSPEEGQYKRLAVDFVRAQVSVDLFLTPPSGTYVDVASLGCLSKYTGGELLYISGFEATRDGARLARALRRNLSRETGFEAVFRLRASNGVRCSRFHGRFFTRSSDLLAQPNVDSDKTYVVELSFDEAQLSSRYLCAQSALLYTTSRGERRIRVHTIVAPVTSIVNELYRSADVNAVVNLLARSLFEHCTMKKADAVRRLIVDQIVDILAKYRQLLSSPGNVTSSQLVLPDALRCMPLYALGIIRSVLLSRDAAAAMVLRLDCKAALLQAIDNGSIGTLMAFAYPNCIRLEDGTGVHASAAALSGMVLIDAGFEIFIWIAQDVPPPLLVSLLGPEITSLFLAQPPPAHVPSPKALGEEVLRLPYHEPNDRGHEMRRRIHAVLEARWDAQPVVSLVRQGTPAEARVLTLMTEDRTSSEMGYLEFLAAIQRQLQQRVVGSNAAAGRS